MMRRYQRLFALLCLMQGFAAQAGQVQCAPWGTSGYCQYDGRVARAYINAYHEVILYFDTAFSTSIATGVGLPGVSIDNAAKYNMTANPDFGKSLFAALLSAQARGATVSVQMSSVADGYLVIDRIWVNE
jgi:hypothetical protein